MLLRIQVQATEAAGFDVVVAIETGFDVWGVAVDVLVDDPLVAPGHPVSEQLSAPVDAVGVAVANAHGIDIGVQPAEVGVPVMMSSASMIQM